VGPKLDARKNLLHPLNKVVFKGMFRPSGASDGLYIDNGCARNGIYDMGWRRLRHAWLGCLKEHAMPNIFPTLQISNYQPLSKTKQNML